MLVGECSGRYHYRHLPVSATSTKVPGWLLQFCQILHLPMSLSIGIGRSVSLALHQLWLALGQGIFVHKGGFELRVVGSYRERKQTLFFQACR